MKLYRPHVPLSVRLTVALRQLGEMWPERLIAEHDGGLGELLRTKLAALAELLGCAVADLRLDHDPPLAVRPRWVADGRVCYAPEANDPHHLAYRPHGPQFENSHAIKTYVRGDHGQYPDTVLIKRERKRVRKAAQNAPRRPKNRVRARSKGRPAVWQLRKRKWPSRPFPARPR